MKHPENVAMKIKMMDDNKSPAGDGIQPKQLSKWRRQENGWRGRSSNDRKGEGRKQNKLGGEETDVPKQGKLYN